ncbi:PDZ and LIM domain protein Zasp isoform X16 [Lutzomyia longipalpis]|uniref:PDZ and LIM domain protein Zasp isoform X16 n=1 Tax=Lutzomyia longipalpis TaxID=7200 RepID=UPI002483F975|nr:PDZ and LIM domain protein Zasp isoform X16 [Lutzomyia longipalpis]
MAQLVTVRLSRSDAQPWGFRLQGGKDFGTPLVVQKVAGGSIAANAGLVAGDAVIKVNGMDVYNLRHKDAQDAVVRGGNNFEISVQRGGSTWRPTVSPAGSLPQPVLSGGSVAPVTHTSLAAKPQEVSHIGSGYNSSARPYLPSVNGDGVKSIVNKQYNTPVGMYSDETIAETLSAQAEVLAGGVLGVNFKKNERIYNSANSEVYKMLQEAENDPNDPAGESSYYWTASHAIGGQAACTSPFLSPGASHRPSHPINLQGISQQEKTSYSSASVSSYQENTKLSASTISAALTTHHGTGAGATNGAPQLGSPLSTGSNINTNISGPKPFNISSAPLSPPSAGPKSPSIYPPPTSAAAWSQPKPPSTFEAPKPSTFGSSTLPRANVGPAAPGRFNTFRPGFHLNTTDGIDTVNRAADVHMAPPQIVTPVPHPRPFTPSLINKPAPIIPYYQQNLAVSEYDPQMGEIFDPHLRSPSPCLREKSPAPGPPPNPLRIQAPRLRESGQQPNLAPGTAFSCAQVKAESVYQQRPEMVECQRIGDNFRQTRTNEASLNRSLHAEKESASATQVGNTFIQKRSRVVEEFERTQSAKTIEIKTGGSGEVVSKITEDEMPPKGIVASQTRRFSQEVAPPKITFPAIIPVAPMNFPLGAAPQSSNTVAPPPGFNLKSLNAPSAFASAQSSHQNASTFAFTNAPPKIEATKPASGPVAAFKLPKPQTPPPPTNNCPGTTMSDPSPDASAGSKGGAAGVTSAPKRGRGVLNKAVGPGGRIPQCGCCNQHIRGPFITALGRIWCPDHFICVNGECRRPLADIGFVEEKGNLYCEYCFEKYIAPSCSKCGAKIKGDCLNAIGKHFHPECFTCAYCGKLFGNSPFFLEEGNPYCEADWNEMFTTKCFACGFPVEAGDRWVEALSHNYHSQCFNCTTCKKNLEGQSFFAKGGRPYCKNHAR